MNRLIWVELLPGFIFLWRKMKEKYWRCFRRYLKYLKKKFHHELIITILADKILTFFYPAVATKAPKSLYT